MSKRTTKSDKNEESYDCSKLTHQILQRNKDVTVNDPGYKYQWYIPFTQSDKAWSLVNQKREVKVAMSNTFGFGGHNACVLFKKID